MAQRTKVGKSQHRFGQVPRADIPRSTFDLSHGIKTTFDADYLIPMGVWDVIPGDSWNCKTTIVARLATPLHPLMDSLYIDTFYFFVPYRILWANWERFCGAQDDPTDSIDFTIPTVDGTNSARCATGTLWDYFGLPIANAGGAQDPEDTSTSCIPYRAYGKIFNDWFRDENLQDSLTAGNETGDGPDTLQSTWTSAVGDSGAFPLKRAKKHDYFCSALPWPQKGESVALPLGTSAPVHGIGLDVSDTGPTTGPITVRQTGGPPTDTFANYWSSGDTNIKFEEGPSAGYPGIFTDLTDATASTINELRLAFQTQRLLERDARSGTRYVETLKAHWGVTFPDYTAQRPVYLGGGSQTVGITPVPQTTYEASATADNTKGALAGYGYSVGEHSFTKSFVEHGVIIALVNARGDITYSQGQDKYWAKSTRYDFYYPVLSGIGEQAILNKEIWIQNDSTDEDVFGYTGRYNEYRFQNNKLTGLMRPDATSSLSSWTVSEDFTSQPSLGSAFIESNTGTPLDNAIAVPSEPHFIADIWHDIKAARPLPLYGVPGGIDHF